METTLLIKQEAFVFKIPPQQSSSTGFKANGWALDKPDWNGKLRLVSQGKGCMIKLEDKATGKLYAQCPVEVYPGPAVQTVSDSSRYFVIQVQDDGGKIAHLGLGFADRSDSFDLNVSLQDHFKSVKVEEAIQKEEEQPVKQLDLAFKEGETIKVNINIPRKGGKERSKSPGRGGGVLPPPTAAEMSRAVAAAGIQVNTEPRIAAPPGKQTNPNWIQF